MKRTMGEIGDDLEALDDLIGELGGDVSDPAVEAAFDAWAAELEQDLHRKLRGYRFYLLDLQTSIAAKRAEEQRLGAERAAEEKRLAWLKERLLPILATQEKGKVKFVEGGYLSRVKNSQRRLTILEPAELLPEEFTQTVTTVQPRTPEIRAALEAGESLLFARLDEPGFHVRVA